MVRHTWPASGGSAHSERSGKRDWLDPGVLGDGAGQLAGRFSAVPRAFGAAFGPAAAALGPAEVELAPGAVAVPVEQPSSSPPSSPSITTSPVSRSGDPVSRGIARCLLSPTTGLGRRT